DERETSSLGVGHRCPQVSGATGSRNQDKTCARHAGRRPAPNPPAVNGSPHYARFERESKRQKQRRTHKTAATALARRRIPSAIRSGVSTPKLSRIWL